MMIFLIFSLSLLYFLLGLIITPNNASYLLSGYNTMTPEERRKFDLISFLKFHKKFHITLGITHFLLSTGLYLIDKDWSIAPIVGFPLLAYGYYIYKSGQFSQNSGKSKQTIRIALIVLVLTGGFIGYLFWDGFRKNEIIISSDQIIITGSYGEKISKSELKKIELADSIPELKLRVNGFATSKIKKGYFKTKGGEVVKLILDSPQKPYILITKANGKKIYYSVAGNNNNELFKTLSLVEL